LAARRGLVSDASKRRQYLARAEKGVEVVAYQRCHVGAGLAGEAGDVGLDDHVVHCEHRFGHVGVVLEHVERSAAELETLAPNMRAALDCPRERSPLSLELMLDGEPVADMYLKAPGLYDDQGVDVYRDVVTVAGSHRLTVRMNDDVNADGPTYVLDTTVTLEPQRRAVVSFEPGRGFVMR